VVSTGLVMVPVGGIWTPIVGLGFTVDVKPVPRTPGFDKVESVAMDCGLVTPGGDKTPVSAGLTSGCVVVVVVGVIPGLFKGDVTVPPKLTRGGNVDPTEGVVDVTPSDGLGAPSRDVWGGLTSGDVSVFGGDTIDCDVVTTDDGDKVLDGADDGGDTGVFALGKNCLKYGPEKLFFKIALSSHFFDIKTRECSTASMSMFLCRAFNVHVHLQPICCACCIK